MSEVAVYVHLFHSEVDARLLEFLCYVRTPFHLLITHVTPIDVQTQLRIEAIRRPVKILQVENLGRDVRPFIKILPYLREFDYVVKLHSKKGGTGLGDVWLDKFLYSLLSHGPQLEKVIQAFNYNHRLMLIGPKNLYKCSNTFDFGNNAKVDRIAKAAYEKPVPDKYGFFAGTMFAARVSAFDKMLKARHRMWLSKMRFEKEPIGVNGFLPHAFERFFGAVATLEKGQVGLVDENGRIEIHEAPGPLSTGTINSYLSLTGGYFPIETAPEGHDLILRGANFERRGSRRGGQFLGLKPGEQPLFWKMAPLPF